jgi:hypothetical protein
MTPPRRWGRRRPYRGEHLRKTGHPPRRARRVSILGHLKTKNREYSFSRCNAFLGSHDAQRRAHDTPHMSSDATPTVMTATSGDTTTTTTPASLADAGEAFLGLPNHLVVEHILRSEYFDDPIDLARLLVVSRAMSDVVKDSGLWFKELNEEEAVEYGGLSVVKRLHRQGRLKSVDSVCHAAVRSGKLEELQDLHSGYPDEWECSCASNKMTCFSAAQGGHLEVLQYLRAKGTTWDARTCAGAAEDGHLEVLQWLRANGCPWDEHTCY